MPNPSRRVLEDFDNQHDFERSLGRNLEARLNGSGVPHSADELSLRWRAMHSALA
jgi:hypothetical protein